MTSKSFFANVGNEIKQTVTHKTVGFYVGIASCVLAVAQSVVYAVGYKSTAYYDALAVALGIVGIVLYVLCSLSHYSSPFAAPILALTNFVGFLLFVYASYMYLADVFYGGINAQSFAALDKKYVWCVVLFLLSTVVANVAVYMKQDKVVCVATEDVQPVQLTQTEEAPTNEN